MRTLNRVCRQHPHSHAGRVVNPIGTTRNIGSKSTTSTRHNVGHAIDRGCAAAKLLPQRQTRPSAGARGFGGNTSCSAPHAGALAGGARDFVGGARSRAPVTAQSSLRAWRVARAHEGHACNVCGAAKGQQGQSRSRSNTKCEATRWPISMSGANGSENGNENGNENGTENGRCRSMTQLSRLLENNRIWSARMHREQPEFFAGLRAQQKPQFLWIGCSDSRVPANQILGLAPGEIFVHRNVGNLAQHSDMNFMSCLEYAVKELHVNTVILCGHYGCGAVKCALNLPQRTEAIVNCWISDIRKCRNEHEQHLRDLDEQAQHDRLCELNVVRQVFSVCTSPVVTSAWTNGWDLSIYGVVYSLNDGLLQPLVGPISGTPDITQKERDFIEKQYSKGTPALPVVPTMVPDEDGESEKVVQLNNMYVKRELNRHFFWSDNMNST